VGDWQILEHTADVGLLATGATLEEVFEQATLGLADIIGIRTGSPGELVAVELSGSDVPGLLVDWLSEFLWLHDTRSAGLSSVGVRAVTDNHVAGSFELSVLRKASGLQVKAVTYHQLAVHRTGDGWSATVFFDV
jgi:SHS2 domain-containing protein